MRPATNASTGLFLSDHAEELRGGFFSALVQNPLKFSGQFPIPEFEQAGVVSSGQIILAHGLVENPPIHVGFGKFIVQLDCTIVVLQGFFKVIATLFAQHKCQIVVRSDIFAVGLEGGPQIFLRSGIILLEKLFCSRGKQNGIIGLGRLFWRRGGGP